MARLALAFCYSYICGCLVINSTTKVSIALLDKIFSHTALTARSTERQFQSSLGKNDLASLMHA